MDTLLLAFGFCLMILGLVGSVVPALPGPPLSWLGIVLLYLTSIPENYWVLSITFVLTAVITVLDYVIPAKGTKYFGGSSYGVWGTNIGLVVGIFAPVPFGFVIGPFVGALVGELIWNSKNKHSHTEGNKRALKAATGSFLGFLVSSFFSFVFCVGLLGVWIGIVWNNRDILF
ncbi:DUF456 domain-containing protein [Flavobacterium silvaticum]|uniref:DUF456 domain-containing protein n=1 Tax=Flavobacterium silvaticum TaxID=1852020 RepID=A0A972JGR7_9FLAO|nr:DUF456 domain-containing protein [Flavobacterium silvaticum]NMH28481.1 DUF456 domain-containing protein [Flavobacterium silvaticum]